MVLRGRIGESFGALVPRAAEGKRDAEVFVADPIVLGKCTGNPSVLGVSPSPLEATFVVLILAVVFGLSTDYEVFLMSRMVEARATGASTEEAVRFGAERTGRIVTAAALVLIVVTGAFTVSGLSIMRFLGVGMIVALIVDATVVRMLLVPSLVKLVGDANWWAPKWMERIHAKVGLGHYPDALPMSAASTPQPASSPECADGR